MLAFGISMHMTFDTFLQILDDAGLPLDDHRAATLRAYGDMLREWNARVNLISRKDEEQLWMHHVLHSLAPVLIGMVDARARYVDIGTGGGLPGIPLAIVFPDATFMLVDSIGKKLRAVEDMRQRLGLTNVTCMTGRVEEQPALQRSADTVLARAVTQLASLVRWSYPLLRDGGARRLLCWKGGDINAEIAEARRHARVLDVEVHPISVSGAPWFHEEEKKLIEVHFS
jgi:16S rRNA (guanine527-N7)-methyltransferase